MGKQPITEIVLIDFSPCLPLGAIVDRSTLLCDTSIASMDTSLLSFCPVCEFVCVWLKVGGWEGLQRRIYPLYIFRLRVRKLTKRTHYIFLPLCRVYSAYTAFVHGLHYFFEGLELYLLNKHGESESFDPFCRSQTGGLSSSWFVYLTTPCLRRHLKGTLLSFAMFSFPSDSGSRAHHIQYGTPGPE